MAEIEVVISDGAATPPSGAVVDVFSAAAYGDFDRLRAFVDRDGHSVSKPDGNGYYALQWAALNGFADIAQYIVERGGDVNASDHRQQTALHWAAVRGSIAVADLLVQCGARVEAADVDGYRAVHVAAQYGQTSFLNHLIAKHGADFDAPDNDGRSALHWAAYKGYADTIRLLLFREAHQGRQDKRGCTPLHWAALSGSMEACNLLVHAGNKAELLIEDKSGFTPAQLAAEKGHRHVAKILSKAENGNNSSCGNKLFTGWFGKTGYAPILLFLMILLVLLFINSILFEPKFPKVTAVVGLWSWIGISLAVASLVMFRRCSRDPGYIKPNLGGSGPQEVDLLLGNSFSNSSNWTGNWSQLCSTCKIIRPIRSKHCPSCKHCVEQFDHHCPWISNCVGKKNRWDFVVFVYMGTITTLIGFLIAVHRVQTWSAVISPDTWMYQLLVEHPGAVSFLFMDATLLLGAFTLAVAQSSQIARNITTNEMMNASRYSYLRGSDGRFRNPYNHGIWKNCTYFFIHGYMNDDEITWPTLQQVAQ